MGKKRLVFVCGLFAATCLVGMANPIDPQILIEDTGDPTHLFNSSQTIPLTAGSGNQTFGFENDTGNVIDSFTFTATATGIGNAISQFSCPDLANNPFFLFCDVTAPDANDVVFFFHGVDLPDVETNNCDTEGGEHEGVPTADPSCASTIGQFNIVLANWDSFSGTPITGTFTAPEPPGFPLLSTALLGLIGLVRRRVKRNA